jgi:hypothetical protein
VEHPEPKRYRKTATVLAYQIPAGSSETFETLEGVVTAHYPDWRLKANNSRGEEWPRDDAYFTGPNGYDETGEVVDGQKVYRKKAGAEIWAYQVDTDDHPPVEQMDRLEKPFAPARDWWVAWRDHADECWTIEPDVFAETYELAEADRDSPSGQAATRISQQNFW